MSGKFVPKDEMPDGLKAYIEDQDLVESPEPPEDWKAHVLPVTNPLTAEQQDEVRRVEELYASVEARSLLLQDANQIVTVDRNTQYGTPEDTFGLIAELWSVYLGTELLAQDVAQLMILLKVARLRTNPVHRDSWVDIAGYAACGGTMPAPEAE